MNQPMGSPLGRVLGRGSAHSGAHHWWVQRVSALALIPLTMWFLASLLALPDFSYASVLQWLSGTWATVWMSLLIPCLCWHSNLGVQVVIEDYVHQPAVKLCALLLVWAAHVVFAVAGLIAVLRIALNTAA
jgi:succinate dehydrogenase / fumarate reductase, membrane anchor subunit